jgi:hypothetical protein
MKSWIYIITTKSMPNLIKIGFSRKDPELRAFELNNTGNPYNYKVEYDALVSDPIEIKKKSHEILIIFHENKEWFNCSIELLPSRPKIVIFYPRAGCRCGAGGCQPVREAVAAGLGRGAV